MSPRARATVRIRAPRDRVFAFHADAANLAAVLPPGVPLRTIGPSALGPGARLRFAMGDSFRKARALGYHGAADEWLVFVRRRG